MRKLAGLLLALPLFVHAAGNGAWQASNIGVILSNRGQAMSSRILAPSQPVNGLMTVVSWRYELNGPTPAGLNTRLCSQTRCVQLDAQAAPLSPSPTCPRLSRYALSGKSLAEAIDSRPECRSIQVIVNYQ
jgi:flagellar protein FlhE